MSPISRFAGGLERWRAAERLAAEEGIPVEVAFERLRDRQDNVADAVVDDECADDAGVGG